MNPDVMIVSFPKSGRTWVRVFLSRYRQGLLSLPDFDLSLHCRAGGRGLTWDFSHAGADPKFGVTKLRKLLMRRSDHPALRGLPAWCFGVRGIELPAGARRYVFLARDPRDVLVSWYHQARSRNRFWTGDMDSFARNRYVGIARIVALMNHLARRAGALEAPFAFYEDLAACPETGFRGLLEAAGEVVDSRILAEAVAFAAFDHMREMETSGHFGKRLSARQKGNPDSLKTRKGAVGGHREEMAAHTLAWVEQYLCDHLSPSFDRYRYRT